MISVLAIFCRLYTRKIRCEEVHLSKATIKQQELYQRITTLKDQEHTGVVMYQDRNLFLTRNIPKVTDDIEKMEQWIRCIENSKKHKSLRERQENRGIKIYLSNKSLPLL